MEDYVAKKEWCPICYKIHVLTLFGGCESYEEAEGEHTIKELKKQNKILTDMLKLSIEDINLNAINFAEWILKIVPFFPEDAVFMMIAVTHA